MLIAGGLAKSADFSVLCSAVADTVRCVVLMGQDAAQLVAVLTSHTELLSADSMEHAVQLAHQHAVAGDVVLLAPACASFDMFSSFEERGDVFATAVKHLP